MTNIDKDHLNSFVIQALAGKSSKIIKQSSSRAEEMRLDLTKMHNAMEYIRDKISNIDQNKNY